MDVACVIPARLESSRFPQKLLTPLTDGRPLICHTLEKAQKAGCFSAIFCLTDSAKIEKAVRAQSVEVLVTGPAANGTERIAGQLAHIPQSLIVNLQGDEPCFPPEDLRRFAKALKAFPQETHIMAAPLARESEAARNPHRVKVVFDLNHQVLGFRRELSAQDLASQTRLGLQCGIYGYSASFLQNYRAQPPSDREIQESHEMLRFQPLPKIRVTLMEKKPPCVDVPEDLQGVFRHLQEELHGHAVH